MLAMYVFSIYLYQYSSLAKDPILHIELYSTQMYVGGVWLGGWLCVFVSLLFNALASFHRPARAYVHTRR